MARMPFAARIVWLLLIGGVLAPAPRAAGQVEVLPASPWQTAPTGAARDASGRADADAPIPIRRSSNAPRSQPSRSPVSAASNVTKSVVGSLAVVLLAFFLLVWLSRKTSPRGMTLLPTEVLEPLGRSTLTARQQMQLIRVGKKLILLAVTVNGAETLTVITDPVDVDRLCALCQQTRPGSATAAFSQVLSQYAQEPAPAGFVGEATASTWELANRRSRRAQREEAEHA